MGFRGQNLGLGQMGLKITPLGSIMPKKAPIDLSNQKTIGNLLFQYFMQ
jgi:hypothetical protein